MSNKLGRARPCSVEPEHRGSCGSAGRVATRSIAIPGFEGIERSRFYSRSYETIARA